MLGPRSSLNSNGWRSLWLVAVLASMGVGCGTGDNIVSSNEDVQAAKDTPDVGAPEAVIDVAPDVPKCPGIAGCTCATDAACPGSACVPGKAGRICAAPCAGNTCAVGFVCKTVAVAGADSKLCVPRFPTLCDPCVKSGACTAIADPGAQCVAVAGDKGASGWFCASACQQNTECPQGYICESVLRLDGSTAKHCRPVDSACVCGQAAVASGLQTTCFVAATGPKGPLGPCLGARYCTKSGLGACDAPIPSKELCDGLDNDCSGKKDDGACDDANACTADTCSPGVGCLYKDVSPTCDDGNACTDDGCNPATGCTNFGNQKPCSDGNDCTGPDVCAAGACTPPVLTCDDANVCTDDSCKAGKGCQNVDNKKACSDGTACTKSDSCALGKCTGTALNCGDGNACTDDACDLATGCTSTANSKPCDDNDLCTTGETCSGGKCKPPQVNCNDGNSCTTDACDPKVGCSHVAVTAGNGCDDGNACTLADACKDGVCLPGAPSPCDDGSPCTVDACSPSEKKCIATAGADGGTCSDGTECTSGDVCAGGKCKGTAIVCDDKNACTIDKCDAKTGCVAVPISGDTCEDGEPCTLGDLCLDGKCKAGDALHGAACGVGKKCVAGVCK